MLGLTSVCNLCPSRTPQGLDRSVTLRVLQCSPIPQPSFPSRSNQGSEGGEEHEGLGAVGAYIPRSGFQSPGLTCRSCLCPDPYRTAAHRALTVAANNPLLHHLGVSCSPLPCRDHFGTQAPGLRVLPSP